MSRFRRSLMNANFGGYGKIKITVAPGTTATWVVTHTDGNVVNVELHEGVNLIDNYGTVNTFTFSTETAMNILYADFAGLKLLSGRVSFQNCINLTEVLNLDTSLNKDAYYFFDNGNSLKKIDRLDAENTNGFTWRSFYKCYVLEFIGIVNLGKVPSNFYVLDLYTSPNITRECLLFIVDNAFNRKAAGISSKVTLKLHPTVYDKFNAEFAPLFEAKGITLKKT